MGLVFITLFLFTVFLSWTATIFALSCLGGENAGFLSGRQFKEPRPPPGDNSWRRFKRPTRVRWTFLASNVLVITFSVLLVACGVSSIHDTALTFEASAHVRTIVP